MFEIRLFGAVEILEDGKVLSGFRSQKTLALLVYLIMEDRPLARDYLAGLFWPEVTQSDALGHLRRALYNLSNLLPDCLDVDRRTARFSPEAAATVDVRQFEQLRASREPEAMEQAMMLSRAPFLEGLYLDGCPQFEAWLTGEQERLRLAVCDMLEALVATQASGAGAGSLNKALIYARRLARLDPWREEVHRQLMLLLARSGRREEALAQYEICRRTLHEELDLPPSPATTRIHERIRFAPDPSHNLPPDPTPFVGREADLARLRKLLMDPQARLVTVLGPGGIGKTRLALEAARRCHGHFLEGVWYVNLTEIDRAPLLPGAIAAALGLVLAENADARARLLDFLRERELLLLLDNFEQLADDDQLLSEVLQTAPNVRLLVTSRQELQLRQERLYEVEGLSYPRSPLGQDLADAWYECDAMRLLAEAVVRTRPQWSLEEQLPAATTICRLVQGSPLALELAAASTRTVSLSYIATAIEANLDVLQTSLRNVPPRHRSMHAAIDHSWKLLDDGEREAFSRLSIFRGGFSLSAAEEVSGVSYRQVQSLVRHSLLQRLSIAEAPRYELHEMLRQYAQSKLREDRATLCSVRAAHAEFYLTLLAEKGRELDGDGALLARDALNLEASNLRAAWRRAGERGSWALLARSLPGLVRYYQHRGRGRECLPLLAEALEQAQTQEAPDVFIARLLAARARLLALTGRSVDGLQAARTALALVQQANGTEDELNGSAGIRVEAAYAQALAHFNQGRHGESREVAQEALVKARRENVSTFEPLLLNMIGRTYMRSDLQKAKTYFEQVLHQAQTAGNRRLEISAEINLGLVKGASGNYAGAEQGLLRAQALAERCGHRELRGTISLNLGTMALQQGRHAAGRAYYEAALAAYGQSGDRARMGLGYHSRAVLAAEDGAYGEARRYLQLALELYRETNAHHRDVTIQLWLGNVAQAMGEYTEARKWLQGGERLATQIESGLQQVEAHARLAWLATEVGDNTLAEDELQAANRLLPESHPLEETCRITLARSRLHHNRGQLKQARAYAEQALALVRGHNVRLLPECTIRLAHVLADQGAWQEAQALYAETERLRGDRQQTHLALEARAGLARAALALEDKEGACQRATAVLSDLHSAEEGNRLHGQQEPFRLYLNCYEVLRATDEEQAETLLRGGCRLLQQRAAGLDAAWRRSFLEDVPVHRALLNASP